MELDLTTLKKQIKELEELKYSYSKYGTPNPKKHKIVSFIKSGVRILGYGILLVNIPLAVVILIISEITGIQEELV